MLEAEAKDEGGSRQDSHANKVESNIYNNYVESGDHDAVVCPLQEYLFGSAVEMSTTMAKKENRTSLGELFQRSKVVEEGGGGRCDEKDEQKKVEKEGDNRYGMQLLKKKLKKKMFCAASKSTLSSNASGEVLDVSSATKLHKVICIRLFFNFFLLVLFLTIKIGHFDILWFWYHSRVSIFSFPKFKETTKPLGN